MSDPTITIPSKSTNCQVLKFTFRTWQFLTNGSFPDLTQFPIFVAWKRKESLYLPQGTGPMRLN